MLKGGIVGKNRNAPWAVLFMSDQGEQAEGKIFTDKANCIVYKYLEL